MVLRSRSGGFNIPFKEFKSLVTKNLQWSVPLIDCFLSSKKQNINIKVAPNFKYSYDFHCTIFFCCKYALFFFSYLKPLA